VNAWLLWLDASFLVKLHHPGVHPAPFESQIDEVRRVEVRP